MNILGYLSEEQDALTDLDDDDYHCVNNLVRCRVSAKNRKELPQLRTRTIYVCSCLHSVNSFSVLMSLFRMLSVFVWEDFERLARN